MALVYRVERIDPFLPQNRDRGPFGNCNLMRLVNKGGPGPGRHPEPCKDGIPSFSLEHRCGVANFSDLFLWFNLKQLDIICSFSEADWFNPKGVVAYGVVEYKIAKRDILFGETQLMFKKDDAIKTRVVEFAELEDIFLHHLDEC